MERGSTGGGVGGVTTQHVDVICAAGQDDGRTHHCRRRRRSLPRSTIDVEDMSTR